MYLRSLFKLPHTLAFRLTLWYAAIYTVSCLGAFLFSYLIITSTVQKLTDEQLLNEAQEFSSILTLKGINEVRSAMVLETESEGMHRMFLRLLHADGQEIALSDVSSWGNVDVSGAALRQLRNGSRHVFETISIPLQTHKARILYAAIGPDEILQLGQSLEDDERISGTYRQIFAPTIGLLFILAGLAGWFMARRALLGVEEVTRTAMHISNGDLQRRAPVKRNSEEIDRLTTAFNSMLDRIRALVKERREMSDNIAHDLRSPLTRMRGVAELTLTKGKSIDEYEKMAADIIQECDRLLGMINTMLEISEAEAGVSKLAIEKVDIVGVIHEACELFEPLAEDKNITVVSRVPDSCYFHGDKQRLQRMVANLLDNALKYTAPGGKVALSVDGDERQVVISVNDTGIGISKDDLPNLFTRFYRSDQSRSQPGAGLGLSLAKAIARAHGGNIAVRSDVGRGSTFTVSLPRETPYR